MPRSRVLTNFYKRKAHGLLKKLSAVFTGCSPVSGSNYSRHRFYASILDNIYSFTLKTTVMANDQRDMNSGNMGPNQDHTGMGNQDSDSSMGSQSGMGNPNSGMGSGSQQRGSEGLGNQSQGTSCNMGNQGGLGSDDMEVEGGDSGRGSSTGAGSGRASDNAGRSSSRAGEGGM